MRWIVKAFNTYIDIPFEPQTINKSMGMKAGTFQIRDWAIMRYTKANVVKVKEIVEETKEENTMRAKIKTATAKTWVFWQLSSSAGHNAALRFVALLHPNRAF